MRADKPVELIREPLAQVVKIRTPLKIEPADSSTWHDTFTKYPLPNYRPEKIREFDELIEKRYKLTQCLATKIGFNFPFLPKVLRALVSEYAAIQEKGQSYIAAFILYSTTAWYCYFEGTNDQTDIKLILDSLLLASALDFRDLCLSTFYFIVDCVLSRSSSVMDEYMLKQLNKFYEENPDLPPDASGLLAQAIAKTQGKMELQTELLNLISSLARDQGSMFSHETADLIVNMLFSSAVEQTSESYKCFAFVLKLASPNAHTRLFVELPKDILKLVAETSQPPPWPVAKLSEPVCFKGEVLKEAVYRFVDNGVTFQIDLEKRPSFPEPVKYLDWCSTQIRGRIGYVIMSLMHNETYLMTFIDSLFRNIEERKDSPYIGLFYCYLVYICRDIVNKNRGHQIGKMLYRSSLFDPRITVYDNLENSELLSALRNNALDVIMNEDDDVFSGFLDYFLAYPFCFSELLQRLRMRVVIFNRMITRNGDVEGFKDAIVYYRNIWGIAKDNQDQVAMVWNSMIQLFHTSLQDRDVMCTLFSNHNFLYPFALLLFHTGMEEFVFEEFDAFLELAEPSKDALTQTLAYVLAACFPVVQDSNATNMIIRIVHLLARIEPDDDSVRMELKNAHSVLFRMFSTFEFTENTNKVFLAYLDSLRMKPIKSLKESDTAVIMCAMQSMYKSKPTKEIYDSLLMIFTGMESTDSLPNFEIQNGIILLVMFHIFLGTEYFHDMLMYVLQLCKFSEANCVLCHRHEIDLFILNAIGDMIHQDDQQAEIFDMLLDLFRLIGLRESSSSVVKKFIAMLAPRNRRLSSYCPALINILGELVMNDYWKLGISKNVAAGTLVDSEIQQETRLSAGFSISLWVFLYDRESTAEILRLDDGEATLSISCEAGAVCFSQQLSGQQLSCQVEPEVNVWSLIVFTVSPTGEHLSTIANCNLEQKATLEMPYHDYGAKQLHVNVGSEGRGVVEVASILFTEGLSGSLEIELCYYPPFCLHNYVLRGIVPFFKFHPANGEPIVELSHTSFSYFLAVFWKLDLFVPLFSLCELPLPNGQLMTDLPSKLLLICSKALCFSMSNHERGLPTGSIQSIACLLRALDESVLNYEYYLRCFSLFQSISRVEMRVDIFKWILVNPSIWMKENATLAEKSKILKHWTYVAFPCFAPECAKVRDFSDVLSMNHTHVHKSRKVGDEEWAREAHDCMNSILLLVSKFHFLTMDFYALAWYLLDVKDEIYFDNLVKLFCTIFKRDPRKLEELGLGTQDMNVLHKLFALDNDTLREGIIDMIIKTHRQSVLQPELLSENFEVLMASLTNPSFSLDFVKYVLELLKMGNAELFGMCAWFICIGNKEIKDYVWNCIRTELSHEIEITCNPFFYQWLWLSIFIRDPAPDEVQELLDLSVSLARSNWGALLCGLEVMSAFAKVESEGMMNWLLDLMRKMVMANTADGIANRASFVAEAVNFVFYRPRGTSNESLMEGCKQCYQTECDFAMPESAVDSLDYMTRGGIYYKLREYKYERASHKVFGLRLKADGTWVDIELAKDLFWTIQTHKMKQFDDAAKLLFFMISKADKDYQNFVTENFPAFDFRVDMKKPVLDQLIKSLEDPTQLRSEELSSKLQSHAQEFLTTTTQLFTWNENKKEEITRKLIRKREQLVDEVKISEDAWRRLKSAITIIGGPWYDPKASQTKTAVVSNTACYCFCRFEVSRQARKGRALIKMKRARLRSSDSLAVRGKPHVTECELITTSDTTRCMLKLSKEKQCIELVRKEKKGVACVIPLAEVKYACEKTRYNKWTAIELFLNTGRSYFLNFVDSSKATVDKLMLLIPKAFIQKQTALNTCRTKWIRGILSNFEYLMELNMIGGRSFSDLTKYPLLPWVLRDYRSATLKLANESIYRDLSKPIGGQSPAKLTKMEKEFKMAKKKNKKSASLFQSVLSPMNVCYYMMRLEPFARRHKSTETFTSIPDRFDWLMSDDVTENEELPPEFFYMPDFLGTLQTDGTYSETVGLPPWAKDPIEFVYLHRKALESEYVSNNLHKWIDMIWGSANKGTQSINKLSSVSKKLSADKFKVEDEETVRLRIEAIEAKGELPVKLFTDPHPARKIEPLDPAISHAVNVEVQSGIEIKFGSCSDVTCNGAKFSVLLANGELETVVFKAGQNWSIQKEPQRPASSELHDIIGHKDLILSDGGTTLMAATSEHVFVIDKQTGNTTHSVLTPREILCSCAANDFYAVAYKDSTSHVFSLALDNNVMYEIRSYSDKIEASCISDTFKVYVWASRDGILTVSSLEDGNPVNTISLGGIPVRITVTPSWGFIVVELLVSEAGWNCNVVKVFTINGLFIRKIQLDSPITRWCVWSSTKGFDFIAYMTESSPKIVHIAEVFYMSPRNIPTNMPSENLVGFGYLPYLKLFYSITKRGMLTLEPCDYDKTFR